MRDFPVRGLIVAVGFATMLRAADDLVLAEFRRMHRALDDLGVEVFSEGGTVTLRSLDAWRMAPAQINHSKLLE